MNGTFITCMVDSQIDVLSVIEVVMNIKLFVFSFSTSLHSLNANFPNVVSIFLFTHSALTFTLKQETSIAFSQYPHTTVLTLSTYAEQK